jgi:hypothetical protein
MIIYHKHHIIPRYMGGSDDPSNLIELTVEEHANAHKELYEKYGRWQDHVAWKALSGQSTAVEASHEAARLGGLKGLAHLKGKTYEEAYGDKAKERRRAVSEGNRRRTGIKYKSMNRSFTSNDMKICCIECGHQTSVAQFTRHLKKHA